MKISADAYQTAKEAVRVYLTEKLGFHSAVDIVQSAEKNAYWSVYQNGVESLEDGELPSESNGFNYYAQGHYFLCSLEGCVDYCTGVRIDPWEARAISQKAEIIGADIMRGEA